MKFRNIIIVCIIIGISNTAFSQLAVVGHTHVINMDTQTMKELGVLNATLAARIAANSKMKSTLKKLIEKEKTLLKKKYRKSKHDHSSSFVGASGATIATDMILRKMQSKISKGRYMTKAKKRYMDDMRLAKVVLPFLQVLDHENITAANRQEIYRLRSELIKQYLKNDLKTIELLKFSAASHVAEGELEEILELFKTWKIAM